MEIRHRPSHLWDIDLDDLTVLRAVVEAGSFTGAGRLLGAPKQTVSRRIAALEAALGVRLLERSSRSVVPTQAGAALAEQASEALRGLHEALHEAAAHAFQPTGTLRITADEALTEALITPTLARFLAQYPAARAEVLATPRRVDLVAEGFDLAVRVGAPPDSSQLVATHLGPALVLYCASPGFLASCGPVTAETLPALPALVHDAGESAPRWPVAGPAGPQLVPVSPRLRSSSLSQVLAACRAGLGLTVLPGFVAAAEIASGALAPALYPEGLPVGGVFALTPRRRLMANRVRAFLDLLAPEAARLAWRPPAPSAAQPSTIQHQSG